MIWMDIVIAAVLVLSVVIGIKRGLLKSLAGVIIMILSFMGASWAANMLSGPVAKWLQPMLQETILQKWFPEGTGGDLPVLNPELYEGPFGDLLKQLGEQIQSAGHDLLTTLTEGIIQSIAYGAVYLVSFVVLLVVLSLLMKPLQLATKLPGLHAINAVGGGILGLVWGVLLAFLIVWVMLVFQWGGITQEMIDQSILLKIFANNSPISLLASF